MTFAESYTQLKAFARIDGAKVGLFWVISFALFVGSFTYPVCGMLWMTTMILTPFLVGVLTNRYAKEVLDKPISYRRAYFYSVLVTIYAALILALAQWVYFQYLDHGFVVNTYISMLGDKNVSDMMSQMGYGTEQLTQLTDLLKSMRPIDIALQILSSNFIAGAIYSLTTALYACSRRTFR